MINWFWRTFITRWGLHGLTAFAPTLNWFLRDPNTLSGFAQNKIISEILYLAWFEDKQLQGPLLSEYFDLISLKTLAWIFTMVCTFHLLSHLFLKIFNRLISVSVSGQQGHFCRPRSLRKTLFTPTKYTEPKLKPGAISISLWCQIFERNFSPTPCTSILLFLPQDFDPLALR